MAGFMFATGIENSYPTIGLPDGRTKRIDQMEKCGHYARWREDFALAKELGVAFLRWGPPYYRAHAGPGRYDWEFADDALEHLRRLGITPILDLCHFGVPDWAGDFQNPDWPALFAEYAAAVARRYPWVDHFTPVNEIFVAALFSAGYGWWNERLTGELSFVTALKHMCRANVLAMQAIQRETPRAVFVQSESSEYFHAEDPACLPTASFLNEKRFLSLDLSYGRSVSIPMYQYLLDHGMTRAEHDWFRANRVRARCVMGTDYYETNEHVVHADGRTEPAGEVFGYYVIAKQYWERYGLPVMHTETNHVEPASVAWLRKQWATMLRLRQDGVPIVGFTWFGLTDMMDWDSALRLEAGHVNTCGLFDLDRKPRAVGAAYRRIIQQWTPVLDDEGETPLARSA
ncbi:MAG TPA: family 1 glycosylhydrolase [Gemmatimonadales bacterium]|nr:family 1 glycosylhydrolase [Gemmatimonadales bacterium]